MSNQRYSPEFRDEAVRQILEGGNSTSDLAGFVELRGYSWLSVISSKRYFYARIVLDAQNHSLASLLPFR